MMKRTMNGNDPFEVMSALQKSVRRGDFEGAMYWAFELAESHYMTFLLSRLKVIAHEDIGTGDMTATLFALRALDDTETWYADGKKSWKMSLANAVLALSRATKSRDADNLQVVVLFERRTEPPREIPDFALDKHTRRGKQMGRGIDHFLTEGTLLVPDASDAALKLKAVAGYRYREAHGDLYREVPGKPQESKSQTTLTE